MTLPQDERVVSLAGDLLQQFDKLFGQHPGFRAAHAKGVMLTGTFKPAQGAQRLTKAPHVSAGFRDSVLTVRCNEFYDLF